MRQPLPRLTVAALLAGGLAVSAAQAQNGRAVQTRSPPGVTLPLSTPEPAARAVSDAPTPQAACDRVDGHAHLAVADTDAFHARLASALAARPPALTLDVPRPFAPETAPDRVHAWLVETARQGGQVTRRDIPCGGQSGASRPVTFGMRAFFTRPGDGVAHAVRGYDVVLWLEQATGAVRQVQFVRRGA